MNIVKVSLIFQNRRENTIVGKIFSWRIHQKNMAMKENKQWFWKIMVWEQESEKLWK